MDLVATALDLSSALGALSFEAPVHTVYNPLEYAWPAHREYLTRYCQRPKEVVFLGMNPGPFGMAQTGVPFGEVSIVRDWLAIRAPISRPAREHPKRPIQGLDCPRTEVSGARLWGWARDTFGTPDRFFARFTVLNWCPLAFVGATGQNITPDKLRAKERAALTEHCDAALRRSIEFLEPRWLIGVGAFAESRAIEALAGLPVQIGRILHPSPASPAANKDWAGQLRRALAQMRIL